MQTSNVLLKPVVSEKAVRMAGGNQYAFMVQSAARKEEIKKAVEQQYDVEVTKVTTAQFRTSPRRQTKRRIENPGVIQKKAYVTLKDGQSLDLLGTAEE
jgi:large subunit ribosomal protein L23